MTPAQRQNMIRAIARLEMASSALEKVAEDLPGGYSPLSWALRFLARDAIGEMMTELKKILEKGAA